MRNGLTPPEYAARLRDANQKDKAFASLRGMFRAGPVEFAARPVNLADIVVRVRGGSVRDRSEVAGRIRLRAARLAGVQDAELAQSPDMPQYRVDIDRDKLAQVGLTSADLYQQVAAAFGQPAPNPRAAVFDRDVVVLPGGEPGATLEALLDIPIVAGGTPIPLRNLAKILKMYSRAEIQHIDAAEVAEVFIDAGGTGIESVAAALRKAIADEKLPAGVRLEVRRVDR